MAKKYKVGDTVYAKGKIKEIDSGDDCLPYRVNFDGNGISSWLSEDSILEPPAKPVMPKGVADEMEEYKLKGVDLINYFSAINISGCDTKNSYSYVYMNTHEVTEDRISKLADAWYNGYTVEKPKLYNLILNEDYYNGAVVCLYKPIQSYELYTISSINDDDLKHNKKYQFTQEEIDKYNKDFWIKNFDLNDYKIEVRTDED